MKHRIKKLLIANRGEIALRIQRAAKQLRIRTVSIASEADKMLYFARQAENLIIVGPAPARESYLSIQKIIKAAKDSGCNAIHPGYGFLSENADFAAEVIKAGLIFVGPRPETIRAMGDKTEAKKIAITAGVPCAPGTGGGLTDIQLLNSCDDVGFPLLIKAAAGGGGRGMRIVRSKDELQQVLPSARAEVLKNFGSDDVFLERFIEKPRHVEVQIIGDQHGNVVHLGTRDCSTQRRHQKLIEEAPAPDIAPALREEIHQSAVRLGKAVKYVGAGTLEFLLSGDQFYFLEMNTRIQVEHPVSEEITGIDLVQLQLKVAQGEKLPFTQRQVRFKGHSVEFRVNAEDVRTGFTPAYGKIDRLYLPKERGIRIEVGYAEGDVIPGHYDGLIAKIVITGRNRDEVIQKSRTYLNRCLILGPATSLDLAGWLLENGVFKSGPIDIGFVEREFLPLVRRGVGITETELLNYFKQELRDRALWDPQHRYRGGFQDVQLGRCPTFGAHRLSSSLGMGSVNGRSETNEIKTIGREVSDRGVDNQLPTGGALEVEDKHFYDYQCKKFKTKYTIEVLHRKDGFFLATPVDSKGRRARNKNCRMSNGLNTVVRSLIADVLEKTPPTELFADA